MNVLQIKHNKGANAVWSNVQIDCINVVNASEIELTAFDPCEYMNKGWKGAKLQCVRFVRVVNDEHPKTFLPFEDSTVKMII